MSELERVIRQKVKASTSVRATVVDVTGDKASVRILGNGSKMRNLDVVGGPVLVGDQVRVDFTTAKPTVVAPGKVSSVIMEAVSISTSTGGATLPGTVGTLDPSQYPDALLRDGTRTLIGNLVVTDGITLDGVDLSAHAADANAHHAAVTLGNTGLTLAGQAVGLNTPGTLTVSTTNSASSNHTHAITSSSNPGANARLLASTAAGALSLVDLNLSGSVVFGGDAALTRAAADAVGLATGDSMQSSGFSAGVSGWRITAAGDAEFENVRVRGELVSTVFKYNEIAATAGTFGVFPSASSVYLDYTTPAAVDSSNHLLAKNSDEGGMLFGVGDYLWLKTWDGTGIKSSYLYISDRANYTTYSDYYVTLKSGSTSATFKAGTGIADLGASGSGFITLSADGAIGSSANMSLVTHAGAPWSAQTLRLRIGNLNGYLGYASNIYGIGIGSSASSDANLTYDPTNGLRLRQGTTDKITFDNSGNASIAGVLNIGTSGGIYQGTGTFASPTTGLKLWNDSGIGRIGGYNGGTVQWYGNTDGKLYAGAGKTILDSDGLTLISRYNVGSVWGGTYPGSDIVWKYNSGVVSQIWSVNGGAENPGWGLGIEAGDIHISLINSIAGEFLALVADNVTVSGDFYTTAWTDYSNDSTITGWSTPMTYAKIYYKKVGKLVFVQFYLNGTSNNTATSFTLPTASTTLMPNPTDVPTRCMDNNTAAFGFARISPNSATVSFFRDAAGSTWTASGTKWITGEFWYEVA